MNEGREFPFTPELRAALEAQRERVRELERATGRIIPWVFCLPDGTGSATSARRGLPPAARRASRGAWCMTIAGPGSGIWSARACLAQRR
jgi:hypothetical protein